MLTRLQFFEKYGTILHGVTREIAIEALIQSLQKAFTSIDNLRSLFFKPTVFYHYFDLGFEGY